MNLQYKPWLKYTIPSTEIKYIYDMNLIEPLSEDCINKIAAGEVIERPASVVKELVDNAIDASATLIQVRLLEGGKELIKVSDNGSGIGSEDLDICFLRYTTSKIKSADDLFDIRTNGFRGEALSSIAAVSLMDIISRTEESDAATKIQIRNGQKESSEFIAREVGTTFEIRKLFYNTPVRAKFLAGIQTETNKITDILIRLSLIHPHIGFELYHDSKEILKARAGKPEIRIAEVLGPKISRHCIPVTYQSEGMAISGYIGTQEISKGRRSQQFLYVDNRPIWNPALLKVIDNGFQTFHPGRYPVYILNLELNPGEFDVNVHPTKKEIRFTQEKDILRVMTRVIRETIREHLESQSKLQVHTAESLDSQASYKPTQSIPSQASSKSTSLSFGEFQWDEILLHEEPIETVEPQDLFTQKSENGVDSGIVEFPSNNTPQTPTPSEVDLNQLFFQWNKQFILTETTNGLIAVDQYLAHVRVLFDSASQHLDQYNVLASQELLFPELLETSPLQNQLIEDNIDRFLVLGFNLQDFGSQTWQLRGIPAELPNHRAIEALQGMIEELEQSYELKEDIRIELALAWARANATPRGVKLNQEEMSELINQLFLTDNPYKTPKGDAIFIRITLDEVAKKFLKDS